MSIRKYILGSIGEDMDFVTKQIILKSISIMILISLIIAVYINGIGLSCDNCKVNFSSKTSVQSMDNAPKLPEYSVNITELYDNYLMGNCLIVFNEHGGFIRHERINK